VRVADCGERHETLDAAAAFVTEIVESPSRRVQEVQAETYVFGTRAGFGGRIETINIGPPFVTRT